MKYFILFFSILMISCSSDDESQLDVNESTTFLLSETLISPGGPADFEPIEVHKMVTFHANGTISSNYSLCNMNYNEPVESTGTYDSSNFTLEIDCNGNSGAVSYELEGNQLIVDYPCIEPCREKYVLVTN